MADKVALVRLRANNSQYDRAMRDSAKQTELIQKSLGKIDGKKLDQVGRDMTRNVTLPLLALGGVATKSAADFDKVFVKMGTLAGVAGEEIGGLKESILALAVETGQGPTELAEALYTLRSAGLDSQQAMAALEASAKASAAGLGSTAVVADAVSSAMNAYAGSAMSASEATDVLIAAARAGKIPPEQLAGSLGKVISSAAEMGVTFQDVGGIMAALSLTGNDAAASSTLLSAVLMKLMKPSKEGADALAAVGMSTDSIRESIEDKGLLETLVELRGALGEAGFKKLFEDAEAVRAVMALTGENIDGVRAAVDSVNNSVGDTDTAFGKWADSMGAKNAKSFAEFQVALIQLGEKLLPIATDLMGFASQVVQALGALPPAAQSALLVFAGLLAATGPLIKTARGLSMAYKGVGAALQTINKGRGAIAALSATQGVSKSTASLQLLGTAMRGISPAAVGGGLALVGFGAIAYAMADDAANAAARARELESAIDGLATSASSLGQTAEETFVSTTLPEWFGNNAELVNKFGIEADKLAEAMLAGEDAAQAYLKSLVGDEVTGDELPIAIAYEDLFKTLEGGKASVDAEKGAMDDLGIVTEDTADATDDLADSQDDAASAADDLAAAERDVISALDAQRSAADAVTSAQGAVTSARKSAAAADRSAAQARKGIEQATRGVADAEKDLAGASQAAADASQDLTDLLAEQARGSKELEQANEGVTQAEEALAQAQRDSKIAQDDLNLARATAAERLKDLEQAVADSPLDEEGALIGLERAKQRLKDLGKDSDDPVDPLDRRAAVLAVAEAENRLRDVLERNAEMEEELAAEKLKGVEASDEVVAAQERIVEAAEAEEEAREGLTEAQERVIEVQEEMAEAIEAAQQRVTDANDRVAEASLRVRDAQDQVVEAQGRANEAAGAAVEARGKIQQAEEDLTEAMVDEAIAAFELEQQLRNNDGALQAQIDKYDELAGRLAPGSPVRQRIEELRNELIALEGTYEVEINFAVAEGLQPANRGWGNPGRRASGGEMLPGRSYLVGDRTGTANAELITMGGTQGTATPMADLSAPMTASSSVGGQGMTMELMRQVLAEMPSGPAWAGDIKQYINHPVDEDRLAMVTSEKVAARVQLAAH